MWKEQTLSHKVYGCDKHSRIHLSILFHTTSGLLLGLPPALSTGSVEIYPVEVCIILQTNKPTNSDERKQDGGGK